MSGLIGPTLSLSERFSAIQREKSNSKTKRSVAKPYDRPAQTEIKAIPHQPKSQRRPKIQQRLGPKSALERLGPKTSSIGKSVNSRLGNKK
jgi:hypothetical protein